MHLGNPNVVTADTTILASQTMAVQDLSCHPLHILQKAMLVNEICAFWVAINQMHDTEAMCIAFNCFNEDLINTTSKNKHWRCPKKLFYAMKTSTNEINKLFLNKSKH
ncbi:hypothetical protein T4D_12040 [Trichinella pseudospiralis]|uniref:Uncharacterized protein n=1 Tax=Trichinella pseudospiralis TaxID=6337 RepID=A0A0V1F5N4_TRIPS|nr:hypothetical protein T4D_12040 [Trichinella pseudospiralis]